MQLGHFLDGLLNRFGSKFSESDREMSVGQFFDQKLYRNYNSQVRGSVPEHITEAMASGLLFTDDAPIPRIAKQKSDMISTDMANVIANRSRTSQVMNDTDTANQPNRGTTSKIRNGEEEEEKVLCTGATNGMTNARRNTVDQTTNMMSTTGLQN